MISIWLALIIGFGIGIMLGILIGLLASDNWWRNQVKKRYYDSDIYAKVPYEIEKGDKHE